MYWVILILFLGTIFYLYKKSKNHFFFQSEKDLSTAKDLMILQLERLGRKRVDINRFITAYDYFCKKPELYDGSTIVRDLFDIRYKNHRLSTSSMWHDYDWIVNGANRNFKKNWKSNWLYFNDLLANGKGAHVERLIGLTIISLCFVPIMFIKCKLK